MSIWPFLSKVLGRVVPSQMSKHLRIHSLNKPFQSAFRPSHSTETALLRLTNDPMVASDHGSLSLLDLSGAFHTIDHNILLQRLFSAFGLFGQVLEWLRSYFLTERTQAVVVNNRTFLTSCWRVTTPRLNRTHSCPLPSQRNNPWHWQSFWLDETNWKWRKLFPSVQPPNSNK